MIATEYLAFERASEPKHELRHGELVERVGAQENHFLIVANLMWLFVGAFRGRACRAYSGEMRVNLPETDSYVYPDVAALCETPRFADDYVDTLLNPQLIVEVLSPSTEAFDRGDKFFGYRRIQSLTDYLLIHQDRPQLEHFTRQDDGTWNLREYRSLQATLVLPSLDCRLPLEHVYDKVTLGSSERSS